MPAETYLVVVKVRFDHTEERVSREMSEQSLVHIQTLEVAAYLFVNAP